MKTKNFFYSMLAMTGMLFATSCSQDELLNEASNGDFVNATFTIGTTDGIGTRAVDPVIGKGLSVNYVACAVFDKNGAEMENLRKYEPIQNKAAKYEVRLAKGQDYRVVFFAYNGDANGNSDYYNMEDLTNIIVKDGQFSNIEERDAFTNFEVIEASTTLNSINKDVVLKRPFAQLNLGIDKEEYNAAKDAGVVVEQSYIKVSNVYNAFNAYENDVVEGNSDAPMEFEMSDIPFESLLVDANDNGTFDTEEEYTYLALNYLLVGDSDTEKQLTDVEFVWKSRDGKTNNPSIKFINIPVQRNYRTNIIGKLLTSPAEFNITIDSDFVNSPADDKNIIFDDEDGDGVQEIVVTTIDDLQSAINNALVAGTYRISFGGDMGGTSSYAVSSASTASINILQKDGVNLIIDGCGYKFDGKITVNGNGRSTGGETLTFKNIKFSTASAEKFTFIDAPSKIANKYNYSHNVTIENCDFEYTGSGVEIGSASFTSTYNIEMKNCTATNMHSILQVQSCDNTVAVDNVKTINCKNGVSFGNTANPTISNSTINATVYGIRGDGNASRGNLVVTNTTINAEKPIIIRKVTTNGYSVVLDGDNALNTSKAYHVVFTSGSDDVEYVAPEVSYSITGAEGFNVYPTASADQPVIATSASQLTAFLADASIAEIQLAAGATFEGAFKVNRAVTVSSVDTDNKATIKGRVDINADATFNNIQFDINEDSKLKNVFTGTNYKYPSTANIYAAAVTFEGCDFKADYATGVCGINYAAHKEGKELKVNNCTFEGDFYAIRSRTLFSVTNSKFDIYTSEGTLAAVWTWGNGAAGTKNDSGANSITFTGNKNLNANAIYGVQLTSTTFNYCKMNINVQGNTGFEKLENAVNIEKCDFTDCTFAEGSETFTF